MPGHEMPAAGAERTPFAFTGTVERVDSTARTVSVRNDDVPGWMGAMSMVYSVDRPEVLDQLAPGVRVRATVYSGDFATLYGLELIPR
jgi:Cu/Ag efflux protein CusF